MERHRLVVRCRFAALFIAALSAAAAARAAERMYDFKTRTLANGLEVLTLEDFSCPVVAVQVWYRVGSKHEDPERQGFAHMFEHMMFRGTDRLGPKDHFELIRRTGGDCNAYTSFDNTTYVNELPANQLELALWLEAERMAFLKIDQESFDTERKVVEEERRLGLNAPYGTVFEKVLPVLFKKHPYRWSPIGQIPHLRAASIDELAAFWNRFYVPNNAILVIVGAVKNDEAMALAEKYFAWIPRCPDPPRELEKEPPQTAQRQVTVKEEKGPVPIVGYAYRTVPESHPDAVPLGMLMSILGGGESSRLYRDLVKEQRICQAAVAGAFGLQDDGIAAAGGVMMPWGNRDKVLKEIDRHIRKVIEEGVTERELTKVRNQALRNEVTNALSVANKARLLGQAAHVFGDPEEVNRRIDRIRAVTLADMHRVAKTYLLPERRTEVRVEPSLVGLLKGALGLGKGPVEDEGAAPVASQSGENRVAARTGPKATAARPAGFAEKAPTQPLLDAVPEIAHVDRTLSNGLKVVVVPNHEVPWVNVTLGLKYGAWAEDPTTPGVASMTLGMLTQGTAKHSAAELAEEIEFNAINLSGSASMDVATVNASCVADKIDKAMELLAEVVLTPTFPTDEFKIRRQQTEMSLMVSQKEPNYLAEREYRRRLFGAHPYARTPTGELEDVKRLTPAHLKQWWAAFARPDQAVLYLAGDIKPDAAFTLAERHLGGWKAEGDAPQRTLPRIPPATSTHIYLVDRPASVQSQIRVGQTSITRQHPDYHVTRVFNQVFGGSFNSRLNDALRVKKGLTYGARGGITAQRFAGDFTVSTFSKTPKTAEALQVLLDEIRRMRDEPPTGDELTTARNYLTGSFAGQRETPQATVNDLWLIEYCDLPADYLRQALAAYKKATAEDVKRVAGNLVQVEQLTCVVVGDAARIQADLEKIAPVTVIAESKSPTPEPTKESPTAAED